MFKYTALLWPAMLMAGAALREVVLTASETSTWKTQNAAPDLSAMHGRVTCPVVGSLIRNSDLLPDCSSGTCLITGEQNRRAFLRIGISPKVANETIAANFKSSICEKCGDSIDPFDMNVVQCGPPACTGTSPEGLASEHFRSTGIRDGLAPNASLFDWAEKNCLGDFATHWNREDNFCLADAFDCEEEPCKTVQVGLSSYQRMLSNDIGDDKRPATCGVAYSGADHCNSQLQGSIDAMFTEFGTALKGPPSLTRQEQRALWLQGVYPHNFDMFSPRSCIDLTGEEGGCDKCLADADDASSPSQTEVLQRRYCVCLRSQDISNVCTLEAYQSNCRQFESEFFFPECHNPQVPPGFFGNYLTGPTNTFGESEVECQQTELTVTDGGPHDFGVSVAISPNGARAAVGAHDSAYVFDTTTSLQVAKLPAPNMASNTTFGNSISLSSDGARVAVGARTDAAKVSAYVFDIFLPGQVIELAAPDGPPNDEFGVSVSISSDGARVAVGAPNFDERKGSAYVFDVATPDQMVKLTALDGASGDFFGVSVSISSDGMRVAVGAPCEDDRKGSAYVFAARTGTQVTKLTAASREPGELFGVSVGISSDGTRVAVGAPYDDGDDYTGSAYVFDIATTDHVEVAKLWAPTQASRNFFGYSVSISSDGTRVVVGAHHDADRKGAAYVFDVATSDQMVKLTALDGAPNDKYGSSVSISFDGTTVVVGASRDDSKGMAYVHSCNGSTPAPAQAGAPTCSPTPTPTKAPTQVPAPAAQAIGDPHVTNLVGRTFDVKQPGKYTLARLPKEGSAVLKVDGLIQSIGNPCSMFISEVNITGLLLNGECIRVRASRQKAYQSHYQEPIPFSLQLESGMPWIPLSSFSVGDEVLVKNYSSGGVVVEIKAKRDVGPAGSSDSSDDLVHGFFIVNIVVPKQLLHTHIKLSKRRAWLDVHASRLGELGYSEVGGILGTAEPDERWSAPTRACERHMAGADAAPHVNLLHVGGTVHEEGSIAMATL